MTMARRAALLFRPQVCRNFSSTEEPTVFDKLNIKTEDAKLGVNVQPSTFNVEAILSNIDPITNLKKEQSLEFKELPADGKHDPTTYHVMKSLKPFKDTSNDIS